MSQKTPYKSGAPKIRGIFGAGTIKVPKIGLKNLISVFFVLYWEQMMRRDATAEGFGGPPTEEHKPESTAGEHSRRTPTEAAAGLEVSVF